MIIRGRRRVTHLETEVIHAVNQEGGMNELEYEDEKSRQVVCQASGSIFRTTAVVHPINHQSGIKINIIE